MVVQRLAYRIYDRSIVQILSWTPAVQFSISHSFPAFSIVNVWQYLKIDRDHFIYLLKLSLAVIVQFDAMTYWYRKSIWCKSGIYLCRGWDLNELNVKMSETAHIYSSHLLSQNTYIAMHNKYSYAVYPKKTIYTLWSGILNLWDTLSSTRILN